MNAKLLCDFHLLAAKSYQATDFSYISIGQLGSAMMFATANLLWVLVCPMLVAALQTLGVGIGSMPTASRSFLGVLAGAALIAGCCTALFLAICHVVKLRAKKQMRRVDAGRIIALVANGQALIERAVGISVGKSMCMAPVTRRGNKTAVSISVVMRRPNPTLVRSSRRIDLFPKANLGRAASMSSSAFHAATYCFAVHSTWLHVEFLVAVGAPNSRHGVTLQKGDPQHRGGSCLGSSTYDAGDHEQKNRPCFLLPRQFQYNGFGVSCK